MRGGRKRLHLPPPLTLALSPQGQGEGNERTPATHPPCEIYG